MREKLVIPYPVIVEGKYDKITLSNVIDAPILTTGGFSVFNSKEQQVLLRRLAAEKGVILLTDPDGGGVQIRSFLLRILPRDRVKQLYVPKIEGKERRKVRPGKAGVLGVEGMDADLLYDLFLPFADGTPKTEKTPVTKTDFYNDGLTGKADAAALRDAFCKAAALPTGMTPGALLEAVNLLFGKEEYRRILDGLGASAGNADAKTASEM